MRWRSRKEYKTGLDVSVVRLIGVYTDSDITYPNGDRAQSIVIAYELQKISGKHFCDQDETLELKYFSKEGKPPLFAGSHEALWNDIFDRTFSSEDNDGDQGNLR